MPGIYNFTDTWNAGGTTFDGIKLNVTDTASAAASKLVNIQLAGTSKFVVDKSGNVGIGTTTPATKLAVAGTAVFSLDGLTTSGGLMVTDETTYSRIQSFNAEPLAINSLGNSVGIGTTAPGKSLEINSATGANLRLTYNDSDGSAANYADFSMSSGGNLTMAPSGGSVSVTGSISASTYTAGSVQSLSGAGAVNVTTAITELTSTGAAQALTLANGAAGQEKTIIHGVDGGSMVLTPTTKTGFSTVTFTTAGESVTLVFLTTRGWCVKASYLAVIAP